MRTILLSIFIGLLSLNVYSQSKLVGVGKATKVGGTAKPKVEVPQAPKSPTSTPKKSPVVKQDPDAKYAASGYMEITDMAFANVDVEGRIVDDFGTSLYAGDVKFIKPKLYYRGLASVDKEIDVDVKVIKEDGTLLTGSSSPDGYTYSDNITVESGSSGVIGLSGWGRNLGGSYTSGQYRFEIWYKGNVLCNKSVKLYPGARPVVENELIQIKGISFCNKSYEGTIIDEFGSKLYEGKLQYIAPRIYCNGLTTETQNLTIYYRMFYPNGSLVTGNSSPLGYTSKQNIVVKPGVNGIVLDGFGSKSTTVYKQGDYNIEYWLNGEKIHETTMTVEAREDKQAPLTVDNKTSVSTKFSSAGGSRTYYVKADNGVWDTESVPSWCEVTNKTAKTLSIKCLPNNGVERSDYITIESDGNIVRIKIIQS